MVDLHVHCIFGGGVLEAFRWDIAGGTTFPLIFDIAMAFRGSPRCFSELERTASPLRIEKIELCNTTCASRSKEHLDLFTPLSCFVKDCMRWI